MILIYFLNKFPKIMTYGVKKKFEEEKQFSMKKQHKNFSLCHEI